MQALLELAAALPQRSLPVGETLVEEGTVPGTLFVLLDGALRIEKGGAPIATITEPGACVGEVSLLLGVPTIANVIAETPTVVAVVDDAARVIEGHPELSLALARVLAARLQQMTTYLSDLQQQYADHEGGLGMVDVVLGSLMHRSATRSELRSERDPHPEY